MPCLPRPIHLDLFFCHGCARHISSTVIYDSRAHTLRPNRCTCDTVQAEIRFWLCRLARCWACSASFLPTGDCWNCYKPIESCDVAILQLGKESADHELFHIEEVSEWEGCMEVLEKWAEEECKVGETEWRGSVGRVRRLMDTVGWRRT